jgi:hypothetical protein
MNNVTNAPRPATPKARPAATATAARVHKPTSPGAATRRKLLAHLNNGYKGVPHHCFDYAWALVTGAGGRGINAAAKSHAGRGHSITYLQTMAADGRLHVGDVIYTNYHPGADPSSLNLADGPHWFAYIGNGQFADQYGVKHGAAAMQSFVPGRKIDTIYRAFPR